jgi:hypothetical protein
MEQPSMKRLASILSACAGLAMGSVAMGQVSPPPSHDVPWPSDSGNVAAPRKGSGAEVVYRTTVFVPHATWLRLKFDSVELNGIVEEGTGATLRMTSLGDGAVQELNAVTAAQWANTSAFFNGDAVLVELIAHPKTKGSSRVAIASVTAGDEQLGTPDSICGPVDDRILSFDNRAARHSVGCTSWLISDTNHQFLTAGHCGASGRQRDVVQRAPFHSGRFDRAIGAAGSVRRRLGLRAGKQRRVRRGRRLVLFRRVPEQHDGLDAGPGLWLVVHGPREHARVRRGPGDPHHRIRFNELAGLADVVPGAEDAHRIAGPGDPGRDRDDGGLHDGHDGRQLWLAGHL